MASLRSFKRDVDYLVSAVVSDCYTCLILGGKSREQVLNIVEDAVNARNSFIERANHPADKKNKHLVRKHFTALRAELLDKIDELFAALSEVCKNS